MAKRNSKSEPKQAMSVGVIGLGLMGTSIATCLLAAGHRVVGIDRIAARRRSLKRRIEGLLREMRSEKLLSRNPERLLSNLDSSGSIEALGDCGLVIESIFEDLAAKRKLLREVEDIVAP